MGALDSGIDAVDAAVDRGADCGAEPLDTAMDGSPDSAIDAVGSSMDSSSDVDGWIDAQDGEGGASEGGDAQFEADAPDDEDGSDAPSTCLAGTTKCDDTAKYMLTCDADGGWGTPILCSALCQGASCFVPMSCRSGGTSSCGPDESNVGCCSSRAVTPGTFARSYDGTTSYQDPGYAAKVSAFALDIYEVTVGRFRAFVASYQSFLTALVPGAGKNSHNDVDQGWLSSWTPNLQQSSSALIAQVECSGGTWTDQAGANEALPITCVDWYTAFAFCIWDSARLATEAEWNYAAAGGSDQREYPWINADPPISQSDAVYFPSLQTAHVGSDSPTGDSRWAQSDLAGNAQEWVLDSANDPYAITPCNDCAYMDDGADRMLRGGNFASDPASVVASARTYASSTTVSPDIGFRCARNMP